MAQLTKKQRQEKRRYDIKSLVTFIKPVHKTLVEPIEPTSLVGAADSYARNEFSKKIKAATQEKSIVLAQAILYEKFLMADIELTKVENNHYKMDKVLVHDLSVILRDSGLFNLERMLGLLIEKQRTVRGIKDVFITKGAKETANKRYEAVSNIDIEMLKEYKNDLKTWANKKYIEGCEYKKNRKEFPRRKREGEDAANMWLLEMAEDDVRLGKISEEEIQKNINDRLTIEGNLYGSPAQPDNLMGFKLTATFFYQCLKK
jgi:hypothetical protein